MSGLVNKVKNALHGDSHKEEHTTAPTNTAPNTTTATTSAPIAAETQNPVPTTAESANAVGHTPAGGIDASKHKPSVVKETLGAPEITHDYPEQSTHRRHSVNPQEEHLLK